MPTVLSPEVRDVKELEKEVVDWVGYFEKHLPLIENDKESSYGDDDDWGENAIEAAGHLSRTGSQSPGLARLRTHYAKYGGLIIGSCPFDGRLDELVEWLIVCGEDSDPQLVLEQIEQIDTICAACTFLGKADEIRPAVERAIDAIKAWPELFAPLCEAAEEVLMHRKPLEGDPALGIWHALVS